MENQYITAEEAATALGVTIQTIHNWLTDGRLVGLYPGGKGGRVRIPTGQIENFYRPKEPKEGKE